MLDRTRKVDRAMLKRSEEFHIGKFLEENLIESPPGFWQYKNDMNDEKIHAAVAKDLPHVNLAHIKRLRIQLFGQLSPGVRGSSPPMAAVWDAINDLRRRVDQLEDAVTRK